MQVPEKIEGGLHLSCTKSAPARGKYDWPAIRERYVTGSETLTLAQLAAEEGCALRTIKNHASAQEWSEQRRDYQRLVAVKTREKAATLEAKVRVRQMKVAESMYNLASRRLAGDYKVKALDPSELSPTEVRRYLKDAAEIERKALGLDQDRIDEDMVITFNCGGRLPAGGCVKTDRPNVRVPGVDDAEESADDE
jgi:hypothetical protein